MGQPRSLLDDIQLTYRCPVAWDSMEGDERVRFCGECRQNVYNLSEMSRAEAEAIVRQRETDAVCIGFYRRDDGTVLTRECPLGAAVPARGQAARRRLRLFAFAVVTLLLTAIAWLSVRVEGRRDREGQATRLRDLEPFKTVLNWVAPNRLRPRGSRSAGDPVPRPLGGRVGPGENSSHLERREMASREGRRRNPATTLGFTPRLRYATTTQRPC